MRRFLISLFFLNLYAPLITASETEFWPKESEEDYCYSHEAPAEEKLSTKLQLMLKLANEIEILKHGVISGLIKKDNTLSWKVSNRKNLENLYASPEDLTEEIETEIDLLKSNIYSFGTMMWEIYTKKIPYSAGDSHHIIANWITNGDKETIPEDCPKLLKKLIEDCWSKDPDSRPTLADINNTLNKLIEANT